MECSSKKTSICIPDDDKQATVKPAYDKGTPVDAMSWTQANNLLPKTEYTEKYNADYYYPGWVVQDKVNYPPIKLDSKEVNIITII